MAKQQCLDQFVVLNGRKVHAIHDLGARAVWL
jgi:hypothetical protein